MCSLTGNLLSVISPGIMTHQIWTDARDKPGVTLAALEEQLETGFFSSLQVLDVPSQFERRRICDLIDNTSVSLNYCLARLITQENLDISSTDRRVRNDSIVKVREYIEHAAECGADYVQVMSGKAPPNEQERLECLAVLSDSLSELAEFASKQFRLGLVIEPLDVYADKKGVLGFYREAVCLVKRTLSRAPSALILDTAHMELNGEPIEDVLGTSLSNVAEVHLCNCVTCITDEFYGDKHIRFGPPGRFNETRLAHILKGLLTSGFCAVEKRGRVFVEVRARKGEEPQTVLQYCREVLENSWQILMEIEKRQTMDTQYEN